jgi:hypothetical protein
LRSLFERERSLLSLLSQTAYASIVRTFQVLLSRKDVLPGCVLSLQPYDAYGANFNTHCHGLVTNGTLRGLTSIDFLWQHVLSQLYDIVKAMTAFRPGRQ